MIGIYNRRSLKCSDTWVMGCNDVLAPSFQAQACLFLRLWAGWGSAKFASDGPPGWQQSQALAPHITSDQFWKLYVKLKWCLFASFIR